MESQQTDPVIRDLVTWLKQNLPPGTDEAIIFKNVRKVQRVFDLLMGLAFEEFYTQAKHSCQAHTCESLEEAINEKLEGMKEYLSLTEEQSVKTKKLEASRSKLELKREQYNLVTSIRLDGCMDLISRYNHLMSKK